MRKVIYLGIALACWVIAGAVLVTSKDLDLTRPAFFGLWRTRYIVATAGLIAVSAVPLLLIYSRKLAFGYILVLLQVTIAITIMEIIGATGVINYAEIVGGQSPIPTNALGSQPKPFLDEAGNTYQDIATLWKLEHPPIPFRYQTGRRGFRNPDDPEEANVYLLGDSIVVGATVKHEQTLAGLIQRKTKLEVLNIALIGLSIQEQHDLLKETHLPIENRLVLQFVFEGNDLRDSRRLRESVVETKSFASKLWQKSLTYNVLLRAQEATYGANTLSHGGRPARYNCSIRGTSYEFLWMSNSFQGLENEETIVLDAITKFSERVNQAGGRYAIVFVPTKIRVLGDICTWPNGRDEFSPASHIGPLRDSIRAWAKESSIPVFDSTDTLTEAAQHGKLPWYWGDTHLNEAGHAVVANAIIDWTVFQTWHRAVASADPH